MSSLIVEICKVDKIIKHSNADSLDLCIVKDWQTVIKKDSLKVGDVVVYIPPDCLLEEAFAIKVGVQNYLHKQRVKSIKLRGEYSHGIVLPISSLPELKKCKVGDNVADILKIKKWEPTIAGNSLLSPKDGKKLHEIAAFPKYTEIENYRNFNDIFLDEEEVVITEKIHGSNSRVGLVNGKWECGSHNVRRLVEPSYFGELYWYVKKWIHWCITAKSLIKFSFKFNREQNDIYRYPLSIEGVKALLEYLSKTKKSNSVVLYGEIFGDVQDLKYGRKQGEYDYAAFDIKVSGTYLNYNEFLGLCDKFNISCVLLIKNELWKNVKDNLKTYVIGNTLISDREGNEVKQMREGIVIKPMIERNNSKVGRVILKYIGDEYLTRKNGTENK